MIRKTFVILDGINYKRERYLWSNGINNWHKFIETKKIKGISKHKKEKHDEIINKAIKNLYNLNSKFFTDLLPKSESWRLYNFFKEESTFLDIETNFNGRITVIGLFNDDMKTFVRGINLDINKIKKELSKTKLIITFNGSVFDLPIIRKQLNIKTEIPHFDLRFALSRLGFHGGLKNIENQLGIKRQDEIKDLRGSDAPVLWHLWREERKKEYLTNLIKYNEEDVINLKPLAEFTYKNLEKSLIKHE